MNALSRSWPLWVVVIAVVSGPWFGIVTRPQWERVTLVPFHGFGPGALRFGFGGGDPWFFTSFRGLP